MAKLIMWNMMTLDGLIEGPNREIDWHEHVWGEELESYSNDTGRAAAGLLFGRVTYELMAGYWPMAEGEIAKFMNALPKIVFSRTLETVDWANTRLVRANAAEEVRRLKEETEKNLFVFGSAGLSATLTRHGLFDEYRIGINPIVLGGGNPLFKDMPDRLRLTLTESRTLRSGVVIPALPAHMPPMSASGLSEARLARMRSAMASDVGRGAVPAMVVPICRHGEPRRLPDSGLPGHR